MSRGEIIRFLVLRSIGNFLVLFSIFGILATFGPSLYYEVYFKISQIRGISYAAPDEETPFGELMRKEALKNTGGGLGELLAGPREQILIPKDADFSILIPKIAASSKVIPNVDPSKESVFLKALQSGVAHAQGTFFPGMKGNIYLFAHSTDNFWDVGRYNAVFYLIKNLVPGDDVIVYFENQRHNYVVTKVETVDPDQVSHITKSNTGKEVLILQTCWPPGTTWKRLLVFAEPKK